MASNYFNPYGYTNYAPYAPQTQTALPSAYPQYATVQQTPLFAWVQGIEKAKAYNVPAGTSMMLMDTDHPVIYIKTVDATGRAQELEVYDMVKRKNAEPKTREFDESSIKGLIEDAIDRKFSEYGIQKRHKKEDK